MGESPFGITSTRADGEAVEFAISRLGTVTDALHRPGTQAARGDGLRPTRLIRDLRQIAGLVELCFGSRLDASGRAAVREMKMLARLGPLFWLLALLDRVSTEVAPEFEAEFPAKAPAEVIVETTAGRVIRSGRIEALWEPPDTLPTDEELETKFLWLTGPVIGKMNARRLMQQIWSADRWTSVDPILDGCRPEYIRIA